jgi:hypothetical protein
MFLFEVKRNDKTTFSLSQFKVLSLKKQLSSKVKCRKGIIGGQKNVTDHQETRVRINVRVRVKNSGNIHKTAQVYFSGPEFHLAKFW